MTTADPEIDTRSALRRSEEDPQAIKTMHDVFSSWERRAILYCLQEEGECSVRQVARYLIGWRGGEASPASAGDERVDRVRDRVVYTHVLRMAEFGIIGYDPRRETVDLPEDMQVSVSPPWCEVDG